MWNCPRCGQPTKGSFSEGGSHFAICEECMSQDEEKNRDERRRQGLPSTRKIVGELEGPCQENYIENL